MGWLYMYSTDGKTPKQYLDAQLNFETEARTVKVLDSAAKLSTYYAAVESVIKKGEDAGKREVFAVVCLYKYRPQGFSDGTIFGYKDMDESMGPNEVECPARILDLLTPTESKWANEWREKCRARANKRLPKVGESFELAEPLKFSDGAELTRFKAVRYGYSKRKTAFQSLENGGLYRISRLKERALTIGA